MFFICICIFCFYPQSFPMLIIDLGSYPNLFHVPQLISCSLSILKGRKKVLLALTGAPYAGMSHTTFYFPLTKCAVQIVNTQLQKYTYLCSNDQTPWIIQCAKYKNVKVNFKNVHLFSAQLCSDESIISGSQRLTSDVLHGCVAS